jgi:hypothetical protein
VTTRQALRSGREIVLICVSLLITAATGFAGQKTKDPVEEELGPHLEVGSPTALLRIMANSMRERGSSEGEVPGEPGVDVELEGWNEVTEAINPLNPLHIAYASLFELRVSLDGGLTWQDAVPPELPASHVAQGDPGLAFDANGRLFWLYLASPRGAYLFINGIDVFIAQCNPLTGAILPGYPINVTASIGLPGTAGNNHDKAWLAVDDHAASPFANRLHLTWTNFPSSGGTVILATHSSDQGLTWSPAVSLEGGAVYKWPTHNHVAPNGDVFVAYHRQPGGGNPNGISGAIRLWRSTDGGATFPQSALAYTGGQADMTHNRQTLSGNIPGTNFMLLGSWQPWILTDPNVPGRMWVVANDDPDNNLLAGDAANVYIARSTDSGLTWSAPVRVDSGPGTTFQVMPTAAIDPTSGAIVVQYYDNRSGAMNPGGNFLLDVYAAVSMDGGQSFMPDFQINDQPFDPDAGARCRFDCGPFVLDVWAGSGTAFAVTDANQLLSGNPWSVVSSTDAPMFAVWGTSAAEVYMCGPGGRIRRFDGVQVLSQPSNTANDLWAMDGRAGNDIYAVGANGTIVHYNGGGWSATQVGTEELHDVWANPTGDVWVTGSSTILRYDGAWHSVATPPAAIALGTIWGSGDNDVYVTSSNSDELHHWNGSAWSSIDLGMPQFGVWGTSASNVFVSGFGRIWHFNGSAWLSEDVSEHFLLRPHGTGPSNIFVGGEEAFIAHYDGTQWSPQASQVAPPSPTKRIGEYNGIAVRGGRSFAVWCGNTHDGKPLGGEARDQQAVFDAFDTVWQTGISIVDLAARVPDVILEHVRPNPTRGAATMTYALPAPTDVDLALVDVQGRRLITLIHGKQPAGRHVVSWEGEQDGGRAIPAGVYFVQLRAGAETRTERLTLLH